MRGEEVVSVVVPAHDEQARIGRTLRILLAEADDGEFDVVVVCNGCTDATADEARRVPGVRVVEIEQASKIEALRVGDRCAGGFPRIYLDADVHLPTATARALAEPLQEGRGLVAGVPGRYRLDAAPLRVRLFYEFRQRLPVFADGIIGAGVYALSAEGRARFGSWPDVMGDDQFIYRLFAPHERVVRRDLHTLVEPASDLRTLVRRGVRVRRGNAQLSVELPALAAPPAGLRRTVMASLGSPRGVASMVVFGAITLAIRWAVLVGGRDDWS